MQREKSNSLFQQLSGCWMFSAFLFCTTLSNIKYNLNEKLCGERVLQCDLCLLFFCCVLATKRGPIAGKPPSLARGGMKSSSLQNHTKTSAAPTLKSHNRAAADPNSHSRGSLTGKPSATRNRNSLRGSGSKPGFGGAGMHTV